jgi:hypothetical protein
MLWVGRFFCVCLLLYASASVSCVETSGAYTRFEYRGCTSIVDSTFVSLRAEDYGYGGAIWVVDSGTYSNNIISGCNFYSCYASS